MTKISKKNADLPINDIYTHDGINSAISRIFSSFRINDCCNSSLKSQFTDYSSYRLGIDVDIFFPKYDYDDIDDDEWNEDDD